MLLVTVELLPGGSAEFRRELSVMRIANVSDLCDFSDYEIRIVECANPLAQTKARRCSVRVRNHNRRQGVWALVSAAIREAEANGQFIDISDAR